MDGSPQEEDALSTPDSIGDLRDDAACLGVDGHATPFRFAGVERA
ncbi:MAG: hypothetical protein HW413_649 [Thermoleophilia bacterium]|nr:hypothetical protein [Thermoleophilia bacterium]